MILVLALLGTAGWLVATEPEPPKPFDAAAREAIVGQSLDAITPLDAWQLWERGYKNLASRGFEVVRSPREAQISRAIAFNQTVRNAVLIAAGGLLVLSLGLYAGLRQ